MEKNKTERNRVENNNPPDMENKEFKKWLKLSYKRKSGEIHAGCYEYKGELLTKEEMFGQWHAHCR